MGRAHLRGAAVAALLLVVAAGRDAGAQLELPVARFRPAASPLNYFVTDAGTVVESFSAGLYLSYAHRPLELVDLVDDELQREVISYQLNMDLTLAVGFWDRVELGLGLPVTMIQGDDGAGSLAGGVGDLRVAPKVRIYSRGPVVLAAALPLTVPTGDRDNFLGDSSVTFSPTAIVGLSLGRVGAAINAGYRVREDQSLTLEGSRTQGRVTVDDEVFASLGIRVGLWRRTVDLILDGYFAVAVDEQDAEEIPAELLTGLRFHLPLGFSADIGAGPGLGRGVGTPTFRVLGGLAYRHVPVKPPPPPVDRDPDRDGVLGGADRCPGAPEDKDGFKDDDGCPEPDNDGDGIPDLKDRCPDQAEDSDGVADSDGCPDPDNDGDGLDDDKDRCPGAPEDKDGFQDEDGCPDPDNDNDGITDRNDRCPDQPETFNGTSDHDGCPDPSGPVQIAAGRISTPTIHFVPGTDRIRHKSRATLELVARRLLDNHWIKKLRVEGHTDGRGRESGNLELSRRQAAAVLNFLVDRGVRTSRLVSEGYGSTRPIASNLTKKGRDENRRIDFVIIDPQAGGRQ